MIARRREMRDLFQPVIPQKPPVCQISLDLTGSLPRRRDAGQMPGPLFARTAGSVPGRPLPWQQSGADPFCSQSQSMTLPIFRSKWSRGPKASNSAVTTSSRASFFRLSRLVAASLIPEVPLQGPALGWFAERRTPPELAPAACSLSQAVFCGGASPSHWAAGPPP